jgi:preprotein translocase subunit SecD
MKKNLVKMKRKAKLEHCCIAILMGQQVYYAPMVKSEIKGGNCVVSGNFTQNELKSFVAIVKNGELSTSFKLK